MALPRLKEFHNKELKIADFAKALSHPARIAILKVLAEKRECICGEIVEHLPIAQSTVSQHLKALKEVGLIVAYSLIIGGGFGNLGDRLFNEKGHVVDFLFIHIAGPIRTGIFNFADVAIVIGVLIAFSVDFFPKKKRKVV